jgi:hypothetical protein
MKEILVNPELVARCGLYCGACGAHLRGRCPGCKENNKATWCKVRSCCQDNRYATCTDCVEHRDPRGCRWFNNWIAKLFGFIFRSDRAACIDQIRLIGIEGHAAEMVKSKRHSIKR